MKTFYLKKNNIVRSWYLIDVSDKILGRVASIIAIYLRGKHKPEFTPNIDSGDFIIVINSNKIKVTGNKFKNKIYYRHSGYPGGIYRKTFEEMMRCSHDAVIIKAVKGMLPKGPLGSRMIRKLKIYKNDIHPHFLQKPKFLNI